MAYVYGSCSEKIKDTVQIYLQPSYRQQGAHQEQNCTRCIFLKGLHHPFLRPNVQRKCNFCSVKQDNTTRHLDQGTRTFSLTCTLPKGPTRTAAITIPNISYFFVSFFASKEPQQNQLHKCSHGTKILHINKVAQSSSLLYVELPFAKRKCVALLFDMQASRILQHHVER